MREPTARTTPAKAGGYRKAYSPIASFLHAFFDLRPGVAQRDGAVEDDGAGLAVRIGTKITHAFELESSAGLDSGEAGLELRILNNFQRVRIDVRREITIAFVGILLIKQAVIQPDFGRDRMGCRNPVQCGFG